MSFYDPMHRDFWSPGSKARNRSAIAKLVYIYAFSNPRCSASGIYPFDIADCVRSIGPKIEPDGRDIDRGDVIGALIELAGDPPLIKFDASSTVIWVIGKWKRSMIKSANHKRRIGTEFLMSSAYPFWRAFFDRNPDVFAFLNRPKSYKKQGEFKCCWEALAASVADNPSGREGKGRKSQDFPSLPPTHKAGDRDAPKGAAPPHRERAEPPAGNTNDPDPIESKRIVDDVFNAVKFPMGPTSVPSKAKSMVIPVEPDPDTESERRRLLDEQLTRITEGEHDEKPNQSNPE